MKAHGKKADIVLELRNIVKSFPGVKALDQMNLQVRKGSVHVIVGENGAGKSTLMKVINGEYEPEVGEVFLNGKKLGKRTVRQSIQLGIYMIHQEINPVLQMTIGENLYLGREPQKMGIVDLKKLYADAQAILDSLQIPFRAKEPMSSLSMGGFQLIEIAAAISSNAAVIIMDEPSSAISDQEVEILFQQIEQLKQKGVAILYITHKMDEIFRIADDITVIRDGTWVSSGPASDYNIESLVTLMVGRKIENMFPKEKARIGDVVLEVKGLSQPGKFSDVNFKVHKGEILGFAGLIGAGRSEVMRAVFGLDSYENGEIYIDGKEVKIKNTEEGLRRGIAMVSEDRRMYGIVPEVSCLENISLSALSKFSKIGIIDLKKERRAVQQAIRTLNIKVSGTEQKVKELSGGNQQKVILAKWMLQDIKVFILDEPTRGIDVAAKAEIHRLMCEFAKKGIAIIMISSELPEVLAMSDRILVMREGKICGEISAKDATQENIMKYAT